MALLIASKLPCVLCGEQQQQRLDKNHKPYFVCYACGTQYFVRGKAGRAKLETLLHNLQKHELAAKASAQTFYQMQGILNEIREVKAEIKRLNAEIGIFVPDKELMQARDALKKRLKHLLRELEAIAQERGEEE